MLRMKIMGVLGAVLLVGLAGCSGGAAQSGEAVATPSTTIAVTGQLTLTGDTSNIAAPTNASPCSGRGGYGEIRKGTQVRVTDPAGVVVAVGSLSEGSRLDDRSSGARKCAFGFAMYGVAGGLGFYGVEVANRGVVQYTEADLRKPLELTLGD